jgi:prepilin-type N-terminal cleavage/methylation domain-containing protein
MILLTASLCSSRSARRVSAPRTRRAIARRAGYTLLEVCVVVALLAVIAALTIPSVASMFRDARVTAAGDMILARIADARSMAMEQSKPYRFGFIPGTGKWQVAPDNDPAWNVASDTGETETDELMRGELPQDVVFSTDMNGGTGGSSATAGGAWQTGGVFLPQGMARAAINPDGTTVDDVTFYFGISGYSPMGVRVRGFIGSVRVFDPEHDGDKQ